MNSSSPPEPSNGRSSFYFGRLKRLASKELRESLRDRRTIVTLVLMPLLVYPILSLVFRTVLVSSLQDRLADAKPRVLRICFESNRDDRFNDRFVNTLIGQIRQLESAQQAKAEALKQELQIDGAGDASPSDSSQDPIETKPPSASPLAKLNQGIVFAPFEKHQWFAQQPDSEETFEQSVIQQKAVGLRFTFPDNARSGRMGKVTIITDGSPAGRVEAEYLQQKLEDLNNAAIIELLKANRLPHQPPLDVAPIVSVVPDGESNSQTGNISLAAIIPLILVLMTVTGAVYPAIDLTAGERERGTLETLMAAPVPRFSILLAKFVTVWSVAIFTAVLNLIGMAITIWTFQFDKILLGDGGFSLTVIAQIFCLLVLFAAFFSAVLLAVTSFARSFKEAQAYLVPIILFSMGPGLMAMNPNLTLDGVWAVIPMVNVLLLGRDIINHQAALLPTVLAILSTAFYAYLAIRFAASRFGADNVLYANQGSLGELLLRPKRTAAYFSTAAAVFALMLLFPINLIAIGTLGRVAAALENSYAFFALLMSLFTFLSFFVVPSLLGLHQRVDFKTGFAAAGPAIKFLVPAAVLGFSMWPIVASLVDVWYDTSDWWMGEEAAANRRKALLELTQSQITKFRQLHPAMVALFFGVVPAVCEEWFFRGMLLQTLLHGKNQASDPVLATAKNRTWSAILISAVAFGVFHTLSGSAIALDRLMPTTMMGILLGYVCYRSGSIWPGTALHALHNTCVSLLGYFEPQLKEYSWFPAEGDSIPMPFLLAALGISCVMVALLAWMQQRPSVAKMPLKKTILKN